MYKYIILASLFIFVNSFAINRTIIEDLSYASTTSTTEYVDYIFRDMNSAILVYSSKEGWTYYFDARSGSTTSLNVVISYVPLYDVDTPGGSYTSFIDWTSGVPSQEYEVKSIPSLDLCIGVRFKIVLTNAKDTYYSGLSYAY